MAETTESRLSIELELLQAMYPDQVSYNPKSRDLKYTTSGAHLHLRLPGTYPDSGIPDVISASNAAKRDLRDIVKQDIHEDSGIVEGEEALDAVIAIFGSVVEESNISDASLVNQGSNSTTVDITQSTTSTDTNPSSQKPLTIIIWLHHLLTLSKRKLATFPTSPSVNGITKPGYPGVLVFSGPADAVREHVGVLRRENWQAWQVRWEGEEEWEFGGRGVREVGTMGEVVRVVGEGEDGDGERRRVFLRAVGIK